MPLWAKPGPPESGAFGEIFQQSHNPTYPALIITRFDSGLQNLTDLKGKRFAFADSTSASGLVYPGAVLAEKGIDPGGGFKEALFAGSHEKVIAAVLLGPAHAGAISDGALGAATATALPVRLRGARHQRSHSARPRGVSKVLTTDNWHLHRDTDSSRVGRQMDQRVDGWAIDKNTSEVDIRPGNASILQRSAAEKSQLWPGGFATI